MTRRDSFQSRREKIAQHQTRAKQPRLDRPGGYSQRLCGILDAQVLNIAQDKYFAIFLCERAKRRNQLFADFLALQRFGRNLAPVREVTWCVGAVFIFLILDWPHNFKMILSLPLARFIDGHLDQPSAEPRFGPELPEMLERLKKSFLCRIFRVRFVPQNRERNYEDALLVRPYEIVKQLPFAKPDAPNKGGFVFVARNAPRTSRRYRPSPKSGLPGFRSITWFPIVGPPGLPQALADKINADVVAVLQKPQIDDKLRALRLEPMGGTPADAAKFFASETKLWGRVVKEANISLQ